jgi:hypothetical protein
MNDNLWHISREYETIPMLRQGQMKKTKEDLGLGVDLFGWIA